MTDAPLATVVAGAAPGSPGSHSQWSAVLKQLDLSDGATPNISDAMSAKKRGRPKAAATNTKDLDPAPSAKDKSLIPMPVVPHGKPKSKAQKEPVMKWCYVCEKETTDWQTKAECRPCNNDKEAAVRDAKAQKQTDALKIIMSGGKPSIGHWIRTWRVKCGPSLGSGNKRGGFAFAKYSEERGQVLETTDRDQKLMKTKTEFIEYFKGKGMTPEWGEEEYKRRLVDDRYLKGLDPDCGLPTMQCTGVQERGSQANTQFLKSAVHMDTKAKANPRASDIAQLMDGLGSDMASAATTFDLLQKKDFLNTSVEYKGGERNSMTATDYLMGLQEASDGSKIEGESKPDSSAVAAADALCQASPAKTAFWDVDTVRDDSKSKLLKTYEAQRQVLELLANDITEATAGCELQLRQQRSLFLSRWQTLVSRGKLLMAVIGTEDELKSYKDNLLKDNRDKAHEDPAKRFPGLTADQLPSLRTMKSLEEFINTIEGKVCSAAELETFQDEVKQRKEALEFVCVVCRSAVSGFQSAKRTFEKDVESQKLKSDAAAKKQAVQAVVKRNQKKPNSEGDPHSLFSMDLRSEVEIADSKDIVGSSRWTLPWIHRNCEAVLDATNKQPLRLNSLVFKANFNKAASSFDIRILKGANAIRSDVLSSGPSASDLLCDTEEGKDQLHIFGLKRSQENVALSPNSCGALLGLTEPRSTMDIFAFEFLEMKRYIEENGCLDEGSTASYQDVVEWVREDIVDVTAAMPAIPPVYRGSIAQGDLLSLPPGWLFGLHSTGQQNSFGISVSWLVGTDRAASFFKYLTEAMTDVKCDAATSVRAIFAQLEPFVPTSPAVATPVASAQSAGAVCSEAVAITYIIKLYLCCFVTYSMARHKNAVSLRLQHQSINTNMNHKPGRWDSTARWGRRFSKGFGR